MSGHLHASTALTLAIIIPPRCSGMVSEKWVLNVWNLLKYAACSEMRALFICLLASCVGCDVCV
jgi:hypothetical protein